MIASRLQLNPPRIFIAMKSLAKFSYPQAQVKAAGIEAETGRCPFTTGELTYLFRVTKSVQGATSRSSCVSGSRRQRRRRDRSPHTGLSFLHLSPALHLRPSASLASHMPGSGWPKFKQSRLSTGGVGRSRNIRRPAPLSFQNRRIHQFVSRHKVSSRATSRM